MFSPDDNQFEQKHFESILRLTAENLTKYREDEKRLSDELYTLLETYGAKDVEALSMIDNIQVLYERAQREAARAEKARSKPFFGRIDLIDEGHGGEETIYIGKVGINRDITHIEVVDWRAPISNSYYESHLGKITYSVPNERDFEIDLKKKRTYEIKDDKLASFFDTDVVANDELLNKYLSQNKKAVLGEIIATIQKEQNDIIRQSPYKSMIVQGAAGSGKTTVAMHRISYILYNYEKDFKPVDFYIVGSNKILLNYITSVLPDLDVNGVRQMTMEELFVRLLYEDWNSDKQNIAPLAQASKVFPEAMKRGTLDWFYDLETFCLAFERTMINTADVILKSNENVLLEHDVCETLLTSDSIVAFLDENPQMSIQSKINLLNKRVLSRLENEITGKEIQYTADEKKALVRFYRQYFGGKKWKISIYDIYKDFLSAQEQHYNTVFPFDESSPDLYDLAALAYIYKRTKEDDPIIEARHVVIDEAQDFGMMAYMSLHYCVRGCTYTIMGDVAQNIHYNHGLNDWTELRDNFLTGEFDSFNLLRKSYRNTVEISHFATDILRHGSFAIYPVEPIIRHGNEVTVAHFEDYEKLITAAADKINEWKKTGYETIAVICRDDATSRAVSDKLSAYTDINDYDAMEFDNGTMVLPITYTKGLEFDCCILMNPDEEAYPASDANVKLLYVAATRALHELVVYHTGTITPLIGEPVPDAVKNTVLEAENSQPNRTHRATAPTKQTASKYKAEPPRRTAPYPAMPYKQPPAAPQKIVDHSNKILCQSEYTFGSVPKTDALKQNPKRMAAYPFRRVRREGNTLILDSINAVLELTPYAASMIRVSYHKAGDTIPEAKCIEHRNTFDKWKFKDTPDTVLLATSALYLKIDKKNGLVTFCGKDKNVLLSEKQPGHVIESTSERSLCFFDFDGGQKLYAFGASNRDHLALNRVARYISFGKGRLKAPCVISDKGYGLAISHDSTVLFNSIPTYGAFIALGDAEYFDYYFFTGDSTEQLTMKYDWIRSKSKEQ